MRILHVCSELYPLLKTGGLADVSGALPGALSSLGCDSRVIVPGFPAFINGIIDKKFIGEIEPTFGAHSVKLYLGTIPNNGTTLYIIEAPGLFDRPGNPYSDANNNAYNDNYRRFALLSFMATRLADGLDPTWDPQVVHAHDWHAGLTPAYLKAAEMYTGRKFAGSIFTIHNLAYQGIFPNYIYEELRLPKEFLHMNGVEYFGQISFMKAGLFYADRITTVSPTYSREIQGIEQGCGLNGLLSGRHNVLHGILNGVDPTVWSPIKDKLIAANYSARSMSGKAKCKSALQQQTNLTVQNNAPLFVVVSRLTSQKGLHLVLDGLHEIISRGGQIVILGSGDATIENAFTAAAAHHPESITVQLGYDEQQAHRIIAGGDVILVPSHFEPCGLTQLYGLMYGTLPLVHKVGGLADTVTDSSLETLVEATATGFVFDRFDQDSYNKSIRRAFALFSRKTDWKEVQKRAMGQQFDWNVAALQYLELYKQVAI